jgi:hypothetical protein
MTPLASYGAVLLYLVPIIVLQVLRARRDRPCWEVALDVPLAVALDLLGVLALAYFVPLRVAAVASRVLWAAALPVVLIWRRRRGQAPAWPRALGSREIGASLAGLLTALVLSLELSRPCAIWDRRWHIPLVASIGGQRVPFLNVFDNHGGLHYHFSGNVLAAILQALSGSIIHASFALSIAHDIVFALTGVTLGLLLCDAGIRRPATIAASTAGMLLAGPLTLHRPNHLGYSFINYITMSFRPHVSLAGLLTIGFVGALLARLRERREELPLAATAPVLIALTAALGITDETSIGFMGFALGVTWLVYPRILHARRLVGIAVLVSLAVALVVPNLAFGAAMGPSAPRPALEIVPFRSPGYHERTLAFTEFRGFEYFLYDVLPLGLIACGGAIAAFRERSRATRVSFFFFLVLVLTSVGALTRLDLAGEAKESHRFMTAVVFLGPAFVALWMAPSLRSVDLYRRGVPFHALVLMAGVVLGGVSTYQYLWVNARRECHTHEFFYSKINHYEVDCRKELGNAIGGAPQPEYLAPSVYYLYAGCRPIFSPGTPYQVPLRTMGSTTTARWALNVDVMIGPPAFAEIHRSMLPPDQPLRIECPTDTTQANADPICRYALEHVKCEPLGPRITRCELSPADREVLLQGRYR